MTAIEVLVNATVKAIVLQANAKNIELDLDVWHPILVNVVKTNLDRIMDEWKEAVDATLGEGWLRVMVNTQANELASEILVQLA